MLCLAIETATARSSVVLAQGNGELAAWREVTHQDLCRRLAAETERVLCQAGRGFADLGLVAVGLGPGSFTSMRVGIATAKGIALARDLPLVGLPSFQAMVWQVRPRISGLVCPVIDAKRGEFYAGLYRVAAAAPEQIEEEAVLTPRQIAEKLSAVCEPVAVVGEVDHLSPDDCALLGAWCHPDPVWPDAAAVAHLAMRRYAERGGDDLASLRPIYVRKSYAEESLHLDLGLR